MLQEKLNLFGMLGCLLCITGSVTIVLHAPPERMLGSVVEVFQLAMQPGKRRGGVAAQMGKCHTSAHQGSVVWCGGDHAFPSAHSAWPLPMHAKSFH